MMKNFFTTIIIFAIVSSCKAQLMQTVNDADKIQANKDFYVGKQFKTLLQDIKPQIICYVAHFDSDSKKDGVRLAFLPLGKYFSRMGSKTSKPTTIGVVFQDIIAFNNIIKRQQNRKLDNGVIGLPEQSSH
ncbi:MULTISPECIES: hypothetical protein [Chitinophagaceae]